MDIPTAGRLTLGTSLMQLSSVIFIISIIVLFVKFVRFDGLYDLFSVLYMYVNELDI